MVKNEYVDLRLPDGTHSGVRIDKQRCLLEVQKRGVKYLFDLTLLIDFQEQLCYTDNQETAHLLTPE